MGELIIDKKVRSYDLAEADIFTLINPTFMKSILITDIIISTAENERLDLMISDGDNTAPILFIKEKGTKSFSFPTGLLFWKGGKLLCKKLGQRVTQITIGYLIVDGYDYEKWRIN